MADLLARLAADGVLNEDASSLLEGDDGVDRRSVVLVGVTGDGKSSTGNTLCGSQAFRVSDGLSSVTQECAHVDYVCGGAFWRVIDTIGLHDTGMPQKEVLDRFSSFANLTPAGVDTFIFVARWGRFKPEHCDALAAFVANCGEVVLRHTILVFTHCGESLEGLRQALDANAPAALQAWLPRLQDVVGVDNEAAARDPGCAQAARRSLQASLERVISSNANERYSNEALAEARSRMADAAETERAAFAEAVGDWRKGAGGAVVIEREEGVITRPAGSWRDAEEAQSQTESR